VHTQITDADVLIILVSRILFNLRTDRKSLLEVVKVLFVKAILCGSTMLCPIMTNTITFERMAKNGFGLMLDHYKKILSEQTFMGKFFTQ
jgi:hypothetical protein